MARGQKYSPEVVEKAYMMYATCGSYAEVAREMDIPESTVKTWIREKKPDELDELRLKKRRDFIERSSELIDIAMDRLRDRLLDDEDIPVNQLTTAIGTLYDKRALARGESTENTRVEIKLPAEVERYAK